MPSSDSVKQTSAISGVNQVPDPIVTHRLIRSGALIGILALFILYTTYFEAPVLIPMAFAFLFSLILSPLIGWLERLHIPPLIGATLVILVLLTGFSAAVFSLYKPAIH